MRDLTRRPSDRWRTPTKWGAADTIDALFALERSYRGWLDRVLATFGVTYAQFSVARKLRDGAATQQELVAHFGYTRPNASKILDALVAASLVSRETHRDDKRKKAFQLTAEGHRLIGDAEKTVQKAHERIYPTGFGYHFKFQSMVQAMHLELVRQRKRAVK